MWLKSILLNTQSTTDLNILFNQLKEEIREILFRRLEGKELKVEEAYKLIKTGPKELPAILVTANILRVKFKDKKTSFSRKVFIPLTNLCRNACKYCGFRKNPSEKNSGFLGLQKVLEIAKLGVQAKCNEALFTLGEKPEERYPEAKKRLIELGYNNTVEYLRDLCEIVLEKTGLLPHSNPGVLTREELTVLKEVNASLGLMLENVSERLCEENGPHEFSPGKNPKLRLATIEHAGQLKIPFTTGVLVGIGETWEELVDSFYILKKLHEKYGHIQEVIVQPFKAKKGTPMENYPEPSGMDILKVVAVARIIFGGETNIQAPPNLTKNIFEVLPLSGINDWGGISPITLDYINPEEPWPKISELRKVTQECGFILKERLPIYPEYIIEKSSFIPKNLRETILERVDEEGYVKNVGP